MKSHCDLLPSEFRGELLLRRRLRQWGIVWFVGFLLIGGSTVYQAVANHNQAAEIDATAAQAEPLRKLVVENNALADQIAVIKADPRWQLSQAESKILGLLNVVSRAAAAANHKVTIEQFELREPVRPAPGQPQVTTQTLQLKGFAVDDSMLSQFLASMRGTGLFQEVRFTGSNERVVAEMRVRGFTVLCALEL